MTETLTTTMEPTLAIIVRRVPTDSPRGFHFTFRGALGEYSGRVDIWCASSEVEGLGHALTGFPSAAPEDYEFHVEEAEYTQSLTLRARASAVGQCGLALKLATASAECAIECPVETAAINRLGACFLSLLKLDRGGFRWTVTAVEDLEDRIPCR